MATRKTTTTTAKAKADEEAKRKAAEAEARRREEEDFEEEGDEDEEFEDDGYEDDADDDADDDEAAVRQAMAARKADGVTEDPDATDDYDEEEDEQEASSREHNRTRPVSKTPPPPPVKAHATGDNIGGADEPEPEPASRRERHDVSPGDEVMTGLAPGQLAGVDPVDPQRDLRQSKNRENRVNRQTDHEAEHALDPLSGTPEPGVAPNAALTAVTAGSPVTDSIGRGPIPSDLRDAFKRASAGLRDASDMDAKNEAEEEHAGWRTPLQLGIPGAIMKRLVEAGAPLEERPAQAPAHFFPETGFAYRLK